MSVPPWLILLFSLCMTAINCESLKARQKRSLSKYAMSTATCAACNTLTIAAYIKIRTLGMGKESSLVVSKSYCYMASYFLSREVCEGTFDRIYPTLHFIVKNRPALKPISACGHVLQGLGCTDDDDPYFKWTIDIPDHPKPPPEQHGMEEVGGPEQDCPNRGPDWGPDRRPGGGRHWGPGRRPGGGRDWGPGRRGGGGRDWGRGRHGGRGWGGGRSLGGGRGWNGGPAGGGGRGWNGGPAGGGGQGYSGGPADGGGRGHSGGPADGGGRGHSGGPAEGRGRGQGYSGGPAEGRDPDWCRDNQGQSFTDNTNDQTESPIENESLKIVHLTDIHVDPQYSQQGEEHCSNDAICCENEPPEKQTSFIKGQPGYYGRKADKCDASLNLLNYTLRHLVKDHPDLDIMYISGDIVPHNVYATSEDHNGAIISTVYKIIYEYFPKLTVVPAVGNHEQHPVNLFSPADAPADINTRWLYKALYPLWKQWIPANQKNNFFKDGYFSVEKSKGLKILVLNTNLCYGLNLWNMYHVKDPGGMLAWMIQELLQSEKIGQSVHLIGHVPAGHPDCDKVWSKNFYNIVSRFRETVKGQFYGHTHMEELKVFYSPTKLGEAISSLFISPSLTTYDSRNPAYKIFYSENGDIMDHETYILDMNAANANPQEDPKWSLLYRATEAYEIPDARPQSLGLMVNKMAEDPIKFNKYQQFSASENVPRKETKETTQEVGEILCEIVRPYIGNQNECERVEKLRGCLTCGWSISKVATSSATTGLNAVKKVANLFGFLWN